MTPLVLAAMYGHPTVAEVRGILDGISCPNPGSQDVLHKEFVITLFEKL